MHQAIADLVCSWIGHKFRLHRRITNDIAELRCPRCKEYFAFHSQIKTVLPLDLELVTMHSNILALLKLQKNDSMQHAREDYNRIQDPENLIPELEPVFLLRGKDIAAPAAIEAWIAEARKYGVAPEMLENAQQQADKMRVYQIEIDNHKPDMP